MGLRRAATPKEATSWTLQDRSRVSALGAKRTAVPPGGYSPFRDRQCPGSTTATGHAVAHSWPTKSCNHLARSRPPGVRTQLHAMRRSRTRRDPADTSYRAVTCGNTPAKGAVPDAHPRLPRSPGRAGCRPLTCPDLARNAPAGSGSGPRNRPRTCIRPGPQTGPDLQLCVAGVGFEPTWAHADDFTDRLTRSGHLPPDLRFSS
jgi:hypothetical protein